MADLVRFRSAAGSSLIVEVGDLPTGMKRVSARDANGIVEAGQRLEQAIDSLRPSLETLVDTIAGMAPTSHEIEFGLKLSGEVGAVVAKSTAECHFVVRLHWNGDARPRQ
ncbi:CU044_2847 family protein [Catellatospora sp. NPDC049111]|uniref:CU044_2847 family protein n=1 Tax=Catellatospora sp. NPDC049111 TaxID=3155271 RepID=UPI0033F67FE4